MKNRIRTIPEIILFAAMILFLAATPARAADILAEGDGWTLTSEGELSISADLNMHYGYRADIPWRDYMDRIVSVTFAPDITYIGCYVLENAVNLEKIVFPENLETVDLRAFSGCTGLKSLQFPDSLKRLDYWSFAGCTGLKEVTVGSQIETLNNYVFVNCSGLERVVILTPVEHIGYDVFENCTSLAEAYFPDTLQIIDLAAFNNCPALSDIYFDGSESAWNKIDVKDYNDVISEAEIHYDVSYDPNNISVKEPLKISPEVVTPDYTRQWDYVDWDDSYPFMMQYTFDYNIFARTNQNFFDLSMERGKVSEEALARTFENNPNLYAFAFLADKDYQEAEILGTIMFYPYNGFVSHEDGEFRELLETSDPRLDEYMEALGFDSLDGLKLYENPDTGTCYVYEYDRFDFGNLQYWNRYSTVWDNYIVVITVTGQISSVTEPIGEAAELGRYLADSLYPLSGHPVG